MNLVSKHLLLAVGGLLLVGSGLSLTGHAILLKSTAPPDTYLSWIAWGTAGLVLVNAGICCVVEAAFAKREALSKRK
ncbi:MAG: hypothetical protein AAGJ81_04080 [Verrucomicrobiota bacterium]